MTDASDVAVTLNGQTVELRVGQTIAVRRPTDASDWQVDYATEVLKGLTPPARMRTPGPDGWRFEAVAAGETDLVATPIARVNVAQASGQAPPPAFRVTVRVKPS